VISPFSITGKSAAITGNFGPAGRRLRAGQIWGLIIFVILEKIIAGIRCISFRETMQRSGSLLNQRQIDEGFGHLHCCVQFSPKFHGA